MLTKEECEKALEISKHIDHQFYHCYTLEDLYKNKGHKNLIECFELLINEHFELLSSLKYYLDTNEENGVVYIPKFIIEKSVYPRKENINNVD